MGISQAIRMAIESISSNKMRSFLTTLGIIIGVAAVIALVSVVDSVTNMITDTLKTMGTNSITVMITGRDTTKTLDPDKFITFVEENPDLYDGISPNVSGNVVAKLGVNNVTTSLTGTTSTYQETNNVKLQDGRFLNDLDIEGRQKVVVIGTYIKRELFGEESPVGKQIKINGQIFDCLGVMEETQGSVQGGSDDTVIIPYTTAQRLIKDVSIRTYTIQGRSSETTKQSKEKISEFLTRELGSDDAFVALSQDEILEQVNTITGTMSMMLRRNCGYFFSSRRNWYNEYYACFCNGKN